MTLDQLRIFVAVAEREHVTQAAAALNLTQSATSAAIAALEERHAVRLFDRVGRRIALTEAGRLMLGEARAVLARAAQAERLLADLAGLRRGALHLAASQTVASYWLPPRMQAFQRLHPGIDLTLVVGNTDAVARRVASAEVDLGFVEGPVADPALASTPLPGDELALAVAPGHAMAGMTAMTAADLAATRWVLRELGSGTRAASDAALARHGLATADLTVTLELPSNEAVRSAVEAGGAATILSTLVLAPSFAAGRLVRVPFDLPARDFHLLRHAARHPSPAERRFVASIGLTGGHA
ncbi:LysR family transcriptional regulator [Oceaniovalibus guishaninsula JLT2003]|uniref:LysR family transcriptional regulator n=1 Tax=Oceaniovalibus guishaninsula JLT2003 TaxID=1231392 RepID=K2HLP3_9RHOB|nr:LysR family transcriptional regulator [Oceaniovalibus guishaninsula]EKE43829.1 LysR family transcriptional regulator [Oceaniovalibus guishaninsula JLT2003]